MLTRAYRLRVRAIMELFLSKTPLQVRPELAKYIEAYLAAHRDSKTNGPISRAGSAARLPFARNERATGGASDARKGEILASVVVTRQQRALDRVPGASEESSLARSK